MEIIHVGKENKFKTINEAIASLTGPAYLYLDDEIYEEKVIINKNRVIIDGQKKARIVYGDYAYKIHDDGKKYETFRTYTVLVKGNNVELRNLTIENNAGEGYIVGQAVALHVYGDDFMCQNTHLIGKQDTLFLGPLSDDLIDRYKKLLPKDEREYKKTFYHAFVNCTIEGTVDFIFGGSNAKFFACNIISKPTKQDSYIVAPAHEKKVTDGFVFKDCKFIKDSETNNKSVYLARPWRDFGFVTFEDCYLDSHIKDEGFSIWEGTERHKNARFFEINCKGPGVNKEARVSWSHQIYTKK